MRRLLAPILIALAAAGALAGCGGGDDDDALTVFAASSLQQALERYAASIPGTDVRYSFAGSDQLAAQIRHGAGADVFASADTRFPARLHAAGAVGRPRVFASNRLVIAVPEGSDVRSLSALAEPGVKVILGEPSVPVGDYAGQALGRLPAAEREAIESNVVSREPEVASVTAKLIQGVADAGIVYRTDVVTAGGDLEAIPLPARLQPRIEYGIAVVDGSADAAGARAFVDGLFRGAGARALRRAGFLPPP